MVPALKAPLSFRLGSSFGFDHTESSSCVDILCPRLSVRLGADPFPKMGVIGGGCPQAGEHDGMLGAKI